MGHHAKTKRARRTVSWAVLTPSGRKATGGPRDMAPRGYHRDREGYIDLVAKVCDQVKASAAEVA